MPGLYDLVLVLDPDAPEGRHEEILDGVRQAVEAEGTLVGAHDWGIRRLAYEIDHREEGAYHVFQFETGANGNQLLERLGHSLRIADGVLRFRTIRLKPGSPPPPKPRAEPPRQREDSPEGKVAARAAADAPRDAS